MTPCAGCGQAGTGRLCIRCVMKRRDLKQKAALTMRLNGMNYREIGKNLGVGIERAQQLVYGAQRRNFTVFVDGHLIGDPLAGG